MVTPQLNEEEMDGIQADIKQIMESIPEVNWGSKHKMICKANNRLLYDLFPDASRGYLRFVKSRVLRVWAELDLE